MDPHEYDLARIAAIKAYADLEHRLAYLLAKLVECDGDTAWTIFFRISAARARYAIIGDLTTFKFDGAYAKAWEKIECWLRPIDTKRNHIVHWSETPVYTILPPEDGARRVVEHVVLKQPAAMFRHTGGLTYSLDALRRFRAEAEEMANVVNLFALTIHGATALRHIFQRPLTHPTPADLLQDLKNATRQGPPQSSEA